MEVTEKTITVEPEGQSSVEGDEARAMLLGRDGSSSESVWQRGRSATASAALVVGGLGLAIASLTALQLVHRHNTQTTLSAVEKALVLDKPWYCHRYGVGQDNDWCTEAEAKGEDGGFEYKFIGEAANLCGECWCCRKPVVASPAGPPPAPCTPANKPCFETPCCDNSNLKCNEIKGLLETGWFCTDIVAAEARKARADARARAEGIDGNPHVVATPKQDWKCHHYSMGQDNDWCRTVGTIAGMEYRFVGATTGLCGDCWCCRKELGCAKRGQDCRQSQCCEQAGFQCFEENSTWAECRSTCATPGWSCKELGERTAFTTDISKTGAGLGQACAAVGKCKHEGYQCYQKDDFYSACQVSCDKSAGWTCKEYGERSKVETAKGETKCAWGKDLCSPAGCCNGEGLQCYSRDEYWSSCLPSCNHSMDFGVGPEQWTCKEHGSRRKVELGCSWAQEDCSATTKCCQPGFFCVATIAGRAQCVQDGHAHPAAWNGTVLGVSRAEVEKKPAMRGSGGSSLSLFCFTTVLAGSPEEGLREFAEDKKAGVFACDGHVWVRWKSDTDTPGINTNGLLFIWDELLFDGRYKSHDWTVKVEPDTVFFPDRLKNKLGAFELSPKDDALYIKNAMQERGLAFEPTDGYCRGGKGKWPSGDPFDCLSRQKKTVVECQEACESREECGAYDRDDKEDATDCCLFKEGFHGDNAPGRRCFVRKQRFGAPSDEQEPIMQSAIEVLSLAAVQKFAKVFRECLGSVPHLNEDEQMRGCMTAVGAKFVMQLDVLRTPLHNNPCTDHERVAFHPRIDSGSWEQCYKEANSSSTL